MVNDIGGKGLVNARFQRSIRVRDRHQEEIDLSVVVIAKVVGDFHSSDIPLGVYPLHVEELVARGELLPQLRGHVLLEAYVVEGLASRQGDDQPPSKKKQQ